MPAGFFLGDDLKKRGPYSVEDLREMISARQLQPADMILPAESGQWVRADTIELLAEAFRVSTATTTAPSSSPAAERSDKITISPRLGDPDFHDDDVPSIASTEIDYQLVKSFRQQIHALGAAWIILGALALTSAGVFLKLADSASAPLLTVTAGIGLVLIFIGSLTCLKYMGAVYAGLTLSYLVCIVQIVRFNVCGLLILGCIILQAHRVIVWAKKMRKAGVPLTVKPGRRLFRG